MTERADNSEVGQGKSLAESLRPAIARMRGLMVAAAAHVHAANVVCGVLFALYAWLFWKSVSPYWFHPEWTTDDALQQSFPFYKAIYPDWFQGDLIARMMECYLAPIHYWLSFYLTRLTGDPIVTGHWVMLIQLVLTLGFVFLAVRQVAGTAPAFFAAAWMLHTRYIIQRMTAGLPRGWAGPVLGAYLYFVLRGNHWGVLGTLLIGCLLHPPATLVAAAAYGLLLLWRCAWKSTRRQYLKPLIRYLVLSPLFALLAWSVVKMPPEIGTMASYERAAQMPEFAHPSGRFPFVPLRPVWQQIEMFGFQAFVGRFYNPNRFWGAVSKVEIAGRRPLEGHLTGVGRYWRHNMPQLVGIIFLAVFLCAFVRRRNVLPGELGCFLVGALSVYFASRELAFKLYVPDRHLQFPLGFFFVIGTTIAVWQVLHRGPRPQTEAAGRWRFADTSFRRSWPALIGLSALGLFIFSASGSGLYGDANFNYSVTKHGNVFKWIRANTPEDALVAGDPTLIDGIQLFGRRRGYVTTETAHPFYDRYWAEISRRLEISLRAHYARDLSELLALVEPEGINYFVFSRHKFRPENLEKAYYYPPHDAVVKELAARHYMDYAFRQLPLDEAHSALVPFKDRTAAVVDIGELRKYVESKAAPSKKK